MFSSSPPISFSALPVSVVCLCSTTTKAGFIILLGHCSLNVRAFPETIPFATESFSLNVKEIAGDDDDYERIFPHNGGNATNNV